MLLLARIVRTVAMLIAGLIVAGILLYVLGANQGNEVVGWVMDAGRWLVGPFGSLFSLDSSKAELAVNWGIAAGVYALAGSLIARLLASAAMTDRGWGHRRRPVA